MTTIAELGIRVESGDAVSAASDLDKLTDAGKRTEDAAGKAGQAWESALTEMRGDTRQIVQELQALNAKQGELAQQMATVGRAVTSASTAFSAAASNMAAYRSGVEQAGQSQTSLTDATEATTQAGRRAAETAAEQQARLLALAKASMEAAEHVKSLNRATAQTTEVNAQANAVLSDKANQQAAVASRAQAILAAEDRLAAVAKTSAAAQRDEGRALEELLGKIDPTVAALGRLDAMESKLKGFRTSGALDAETFGEYQGKIDQARTALGGADAALNKTGMTAKATAAALRNVPAQFTDIVVSLQGGQAPLTVLLQQGGQLKDMFGGVGPAIQALGGYVLGLVNPFTVAATAMGVLGYAYYKGSEEAVGFQKALITTGNAAGTTADRLSGMAAQVSATVGSTGAAAEVLTQLAGSGKIAADSFVEITEAALDWRDATGRAVEDTVAEFVKIGKDPVTAAKELNEQYNFLTAATYSQIVALKEQGDTIGAAKLLTDTFVDTIKNRSQEVTENLSLWEKAWKAIRGEAAATADAIKDIGRDQDIASQIVEAQQRAAAARSALNGDPDDTDAKKKLTDANLQLQVLKKQQETLDAAAKARALEAAQQQAANLAIDKIDAREKSSRTNAEKRLDALKEYRKELDDLRLKNPSDERLAPDRIARVEANIAKQFKDPAGPKAPVDLSSFNDQKNALTAILGEYKNKQKELQAAQKAGVVSQETYTAQRAALLQQQKTDVTEAYQAEINALEEAKGRSSTTAEQRIQLDQKIANVRAAMVKAQKDADSELAVLATKEQGRLAKQALAVQTYTDALEQQVKALQLQGQRAADSLGLGDRQRSLQDQQNSITDRMNQQRLSLANQYGDGSRGMSLDEYNQKLTALANTERDLQRTVISSYDTMTEAMGNWGNGASSAFQNYLDQARDVAGQSRALFTHAFDNMEDAIVNFVKTGKLSFKDFADQVISDLIRIQVRQAAAGFLSSAFGFLGGGGAALGKGTMTGFSEPLKPAAFASGGYTGPGGVDEPAGIVHKGEVVWSQYDVRRFGGVGAVEELRTGGMSAAYGGRLSSRPGGESASPSSSAMPTIKQQIIVQGSADEATLARIRQAAQKGAQDGYNLVLRDLKQNGPARQLITRR